MSGITIYDSGEQKISMVSPEFLGPQNSCPEFPEDQNAR